MTDCFTGPDTEMIHVIDASNIRNLTTLAHIRVRNLNFKDVKVCGEGVFATYYNLSDRSDGGVHVTKRYNAAAESMQHLHNIKCKSGQQPEREYRVLWSMSAFRNIKCKSGQQPEREYRVLWSLSVIRDYTGYALTGNVQQCTG